jgi:hypothetical protein
MNMQNTEYKSKINIGEKHSLTNTISAKLDKSGTAFVDFDGGDLSNAKVGIKDLNVLDDLVASVEWTNSKKAGKLKLVSTRIDNVTITAEPNLPLPADLSTVKVEVQAKQSLDICDAKVTVNPLARTATLELVKALDHQLCKEAKLEVNATSQNGTLTLTTPTKRQMDIDHSLELKLVASKSGLDSAQCVYKAGVTDELSAKLTLKDNKTGSLSADYKLGPNMKAVAEMPITSLNAQGLGKPTFTIDTTYEF